MRLRPLISNKRPLIAISSCLLGEAVRYDGTAKHQAWITDVLAKDVDFLSLCPEIAIGLGVPRPAVHLRELVDGIHMLGVADPDNDFTPLMSQHAQAIVQQLAQVNGYIFKAKSPSCGLDDVKLTTLDNDLNRDGQGLYSAIIRSALPNLPVIDERHLLDDAERRHFVEAVFSYNKSCPIENISTAS